MLTQEWLCLIFTTWPQFAQDCIKPRRQWTICLKRTQKQKQLLYKTTFPSKLFVQLGGPSAYLRALAQAREWARCHWVHADRATRHQLTRESCTGRWSRGQPAWSCRWWGWVPHSAASDPTWWLSCEAQWLRQQQQQRWPPSPKGPKTAQNTNEIGLNETNSFNSPRNLGGRGNKGVRPIKGTQQPRQC